MTQDTATQDVNRFYNAQNPDQAIAQRNDTLRSYKIPPTTIRKAWFIMAHLLLDDGAKIAHMGCSEGETTFVMALLNPHLNFIGIDKNKRKITRANARFELDNLEFKVGDINSTALGTESLDAIIDCYVLHEVYSSSRYDEATVSETLKNHHSLLKKGGQLFIQDYVRPPPEEMILIEMPDHPSTSDNIQDMSEADLLVWYAQHARPKHDPGCGGFFLEELPPHFPKTRLFRLPHKWAYEFIMRKDDRAAWETELPMQYTFFTKRELRKSLSQLGMRTQYAAPYWDDDIINDHFNGKFRLYSDDGTPLDDPAIGYITVNTKLADRKSLEISERRPSSKTDDTKIEIVTMRNNKTGGLVDVAKRKLNTSDILPYRINEDGRIKIFLHVGRIRSITQTIPRTGGIIDDKRWSGHLTEAITVETSDLPNAPVDQADFKTTLQFSQNHLGLKPIENAALKLGPENYPAPDFIDEKIQTYFIEVSKPKNAQITPKKPTLAAYRFQAKGEIKECDAQQILDAISVGLIPNARLELQILALFAHLNRKAENWTKKHILLQAAEPQKNLSLNARIANLGLDQTLFENTKGSANQLRAMQSIFVEEGQSRGAVTGLSYEDVSFVLKNEETLNIATVLPLNKDTKGLINAGFLIDQMPVPQRHEGNGLTMMAPSFVLPPEANNQRMIKKFLAKRFGVLPDNIVKLGEPYFTFSPLSPQRIHPYAVAMPNSALDDPKAVFMPMYQIILMARSKKFVRSGNLAALIGRSFRYMSDEMGYDAKLASKYMNKNDTVAQSPDLSIPMEYYRAPSLPEPSVQTVTVKTPNKPVQNAPAKSAPVALKESDAPKFAAQNTPSSPRPKEPLEKSKKFNTAIQNVIRKAEEIIAPPKPEEITKENAPDISYDFDKEIDRLEEDLNAIPDLHDYDHMPKPEKW